MSNRAGGRSRFAIGHVVVEVAFGLGRHLRCSCGAMIVGARTDQVQGRILDRHRRFDPPEPPGRRPARVGASTEHLATESFTERVSGW